MALTDLSSAKAFLSIAAATTAYDGLLTQLVTAADAAVKAYCGRDLETASYTEYYDGSGRPELVLRQRPVTAVSALYLDLGGYYGDSPTAFASTTQLTLGTDYVLVRDGPGGRSDSGLLRLLRGAYNLAGWGYAAAGLGAALGPLTSGRRAIWPPVAGCVKVTFTAGYGVGPGNVPADLTLAANTLVAWLRRNAQAGGPLQSESMGQYSYQIAVQALGNGTAPEIGEVRGLLARYREVVI